MSADYCTVNTAQIDGDTGMVTVNAVNPLTDDSEDVEQFGTIDLMHPIGFASVPYPPTDDGSAQVLVMRDVGNADGVATVGTDERAAKTVGELVPGDAAIFSTGPKNAARVICKEENQAVAVIVDDSKGKNALINVDGKNDKIQINGFGLMIELSRDQGITMSDGPATLQIKDGTIMLTGRVILGGRTPTLPILAGAPGPPTLGTAVPGVFVGIV